MREAREPYTEITIGNENVIVRRDNLIVRRYLGANAIYDHCQVNGQHTYGYVWQFNRCFTSLTRLAEQLGAQIMLNIPNTSKGIVDEYERRADIDFRTIRDLHDLSRF